MTAAASHSQTAAISPLPAASVARWDREHDVVVVGHGGAGASAAIEAARGGADTVVLERMTLGGGTTASSTGVIYFGGGTPIQKACGFDDSIDEMQKFVRLAAGAHADETKVRLFCESSIEHFEWIRQLGVEFRESFVAEKTTHPFEDDCLFYSGNEQAYPFVSQAVPAPRGHKPARPGEAGGFLMQCLLRATEEAGARVLNESRVERLIQDTAGRVVGAVVHHGAAPLQVKARRGVVLCAGGFIMNAPMVTEHAPHLLVCRYKLGTPGDDGAGIRMGMGAGGQVINMHEGLVLNAYYPPASHLMGVLVDAHGHRFINEDAYLGRTSDAMLTRADGRAWLIVDDAMIGPTQAGHRMAAVEGSFEDLERVLGMPDGVLVQTLETYNRFAARAEDPAFHKAAAYLRPLTPPCAALDCTTSNSIYGALTLGGLAVRATGEVRTAGGHVVPGLYAAGRTAAGLPLEGRTYASGLSIGDATFFGRLAGRSAATMPPWG